jgi:hypothetical protein
VLCLYWLISLRLRVANFSARVFGNKAGQCRIGTCTEGSCSETWPAAHNVQALVRLIWEHELAALSMRAWRYIALTRRIRSKSNSASWNYSRYALRPWPFFASSP